MANDVQHERWGEFVTRYRPMMEAFMRERFPSLEADDIIQETLIALCKILPSYRYAPDEKGHFRNFLTGILRNKARTALRKEQHQSLFLAEAGGSRLSRPQREGRAPARPTREITLLFNRTGKVGGEIRIVKKDAEGRVLSSSSSPLAETVTPQKGVLLK